VGDAAAVVTASTAHIAANNSTALQRLWHMALS